MFSKKRFLLLLLLPLFGALPLRAQDQSGSGQGNGFNFQGMGDGTGTSQLIMPVGYTRIGDQNFISLRLQPELAFGKFGIGLDIPLLYNTDKGTFRTEEYKGGVGALRIFRYVRYGDKHKDPVYVRVGDMTGSMLGQGLIMYNYTNATSFEKRKIGVNWDFNYNQQYGLEGIYSDFSGANIIGFRPYFRPLKNTGIPIIKTTEFGVTYITDRDKHITYDDNDPLTAPNPHYSTTEWGTDVSVTILENSFVQIVPYIEFAHLLENSDFKKDLQNGQVIGLDGSIVDSQSKYAGGSGIAYGANFKFNLIADVLNMGAKIERRYYSNHFVPQYFDAVYEINKYRKMLGLIDAEGVQGTYGELFANLIKKVQVIGGMSIPDKLKKSDGAFVHLGLAAPDLIPQVVISGSYDKGYLTDLKDAFKLDQRSLMDVRTAYKVYPYLLAGVDYKWTFAKKANGEVKATKYVMPFVALQYALPFGNQSKQ